jgi:hypothetical protein
MELIEAILLGVSFLLAVIVIFFGLNCLKRLAGNLKLAVIFLISAMGARIVRELLTFFDVLQSFYFDVAFRIINAIFIFLVIFYIGRMIKKVDGNEIKNSLKSKKKR